MRTPQGGGDELARHCVPDSHLRRSTGDLRDERCGQLFTRQTLSGACGSPLPAHVEAARGGGGGHSGGQGTAGQPGLGRDGGAGAAGARRARGEQRRLRQGRASKVPVRPLAASSSASSRRSRWARSPSTSGSPAQPQRTVRSRVGAADAVVDGPEPPIGVPEAVRTLPIRVVDDGVEHGKGSNVLASGVHHGDGPAGRGLPEKVPIQPGGTWPSGTRSTTRSSASGENGSPIQRWTDPGPSGPSGGRSAGRAASRRPPTRGWAASRPASVPSGSPTAAPPRTGL